jgi:hypothetical protein
MRRTFRHRSLMEDCPTSAPGPTRKWLSVSTTSAFWGTPDSLCSPRAFPSLAHRDVASKIHVRNAPKADKPEPTRMTPREGFMPA